jgi:vancomycin resistance protein YoaR
VGNLEPPPDVPEDQSGMPAVPTPRTTLPGDKPRSAEGTRQEHAAPAYSSTTATRELSASERAADDLIGAPPSSPMPNYGTAAVPAPNVDDTTSETNDAATRLTAAVPLRPRHLRRTAPADTARTPVENLRGLLTPRNALVFVPAVVVALIGLIVVSWAIDNARHSDQVHRNVSVAGTSVGGATEETLSETVSSIAKDVGERPVVVVVDGTEIDSVSAADLGLSMDEEAAVEAAMDVGRDGSILTRPFEWLGSMLGGPTVTPELTVSETQLSAALQTVYEQSIENTDTVTQASNPSIELTNGEFTLQPGQPGTGLDLDQAADNLQTAADEADDPFSDLELAVETSELAPDIADGDVQTLADDLNNLTASGITLNAGGAEQSLTADQLRAWITPIVEPEDAVGVEHIGPEELDNLQPLDWEPNYGATDEAVLEAFSDLRAEPVDAEPVLTGGTVEVTESENGVTCCGEDVGQKVWEAIEAGETDLELEAEVVEPEFTTEEVEGWGISQPIGGSRGWRSGAEVPGPTPGYTTWDVETGAARAHNIGQMANEVNGAYIAPGDTWSINDHVGARQCPPYKEAGAIRDNEHVDDECGGGTSQFATTTLNAAYFAGLDVTGQAHSEYFDRYPAGREATMGEPGTPLDVTITNNTEYGVIIQSARNGDSLTVTLWSTPSITVQDLGNQESMEGKCRVVTNTRERTFPDGSKSTDTFRAVYRPGEGETC